MKKLILIALALVMVTVVSLQASEKSRGSPSVKDQIAFITGSTFFVTPLNNQANFPRSQMLSSQVVVITNCEDTVVFTEQSGTMPEIFQTCQLMRPTMVLKKPLISTILFSTRENYGAGGPMNVIWPNNSELMLSNNNATRMICEGPIMVLKKPLTSNTTASTCVNPLTKGSTQPIMKRCQSSRNL